jgi:Tfp pilus assembly protein PilO/Tfp pilus assembly protein PilN
MIEINLLPGAGKKKSAARRQSVDMSAALAGISGRFKDRVLIGTVAASVVALAATGWMYYSQQRDQTQLDAALATAIADSTKFSTIFEARTKAEATRDTLLRQLNVIKAIDQDRFIWPHVMDEVSRALPQYTWLSLVTFTGNPQGAVNNAALPPKDTTKPPGNKPRKPKRLDTNVPPDPVMIRVMGQTVDIQALTQFIRQLEASPFLGGVVIDLSERASAQGKEVTQFTLTMAYERPEPSATRVQGAIAMALDQRQQRLVLVAALFVIGAGAYWYVPYSDKKVELDALRTRVAILDTLNREVQRLATGGNLDTLIAEGARYERELDAMRRLVPSQNQVPGLLDNISEAARRVNLDFSDFRPKGVLPGDHFDVYKYEFIVTGPYHRVAQFITNIGSLERIVAPMNLNIAPGAPTADRKPRRDETFVTARFDIQTYVAKTSTPRLVTPPAGGGGVP